MASPLSGHTHGTNTPASLSHQQSHNTYNNQQQQQQYHEGQQYQQNGQQYHDGQYDQGLMTPDYQGKEVVTNQAAQASFYAVQQQTLPSAQTPPEKRICGLRKVTFLLTLLAALLLIGAIGAGVAAGVISSQKSSGSSGSDESSSGGSPSETPSSSPSPSSSASSASDAPSSTPSASSTRSASDSEFTAIRLPDESTGLGVAQSNCPGSNLTDTAIPGTDLVFRHECGINYPASDLGQIPMTTMEDCLLLCASQNVRPQGSAGPCVGVVWVTRSRQGLDGSACWLKSQKNIPSYEPDVEAAWLMSVSDFADDD